MNKSTVCFLTATSITASLIITGCKKENVPIVNASPVTNITADNAPPAIISIIPATIGTTTATFNCIANANGLYTDVALEYGTSADYRSSVSASQNPVTGVENSTMIINFNGLTTTTLYHCRVKAVNALGTTYGSDFIFSTLLADIMGNAYNTITLGTQEWMQENLRTTEYSNGDLIGTTVNAMADISSETNP